MSTINDDDLLLVERGGVQYKLAASDLDLVSGFIGSPVEVLTPLDGAGVGGAFNYTAKTDDIESSTAILHEGFVSRSEFAAGSWEGPKGLVEGNNGRIVGIAEGSSGIFYTDDDGKTFTQPSHTGDNFKDICFNGSNYVAVGPNSIIYSSDGHNWSSATQPSNVQTIYSCAAAPNNGRIVICGRANNSSNAPYAYSDDGGATWTASNKSSQHSGSTQTVYVVKYGGGKFVTLERNNNWSEYSSNGINWSYNSNRGWYLRAKGIAYSDDQSRWLMIGTNSGGATYAFESTNGSSWSEEDLVSTSEFREPASEGPFVLAYGAGNWAYAFSAGSGFGCTYGGSTTSWGHNYVNDNTSTMIGVAFVKNKWVMFGSSPSGLYFSKDMSLVSTLAMGNLFPTAQTSHTTITFASDTVFNQSGGAAVDGADFVEAFDRELRYLGSSVNNIMTPISVSGRSITVDNDNHGYSAGPYGFVSNSTLTQYGPSPSEVEFTSQNSGTTAVSGSDATLSFRKWTLETRASSSDPWTVVTEADDYSPVASQNGATPWAGKPTLQANTQYRVKVEYNSANARAVESNYITFTTGNS